MERDSLESVVIETVRYYWRAGSLPGEPETLSGEFSLAKLLSDLLALRRKFPGIRLSDLMPEEVLLGVFRRL